MDTVTLQNYRCFGDEQTVRLAPLTLLVGENSTGKTSFLALLRALWDVGHGGTRPNFRRAPYDLGTFREVAHNRGSRGAPAPAFSAGCESATRGPHNVTDARPAAPPDETDLRVQVEFENRDAEPFPVRTRFARGPEWIELRFDADTRVHRFGTAAGEWEYGFGDRPLTPDAEPFEVGLLSMRYHLATLHQDPPPASVTQALTHQSGGAPPFEDQSALLRLAESVPFPPHEAAVLRGGPGALPATTNL